MNDTDSFTRFPEQSVKPFTGQLPPVIQRASNLFRDGGAYIASYLASARGLSPSQFRILARAIGEVEGTRTSLDVAARKAAANPDDPTMQLTSGRPMSPPTAPAKSHSPGAVELPPALRTASDGLRDAACAVASYLATAGDLNPHQRRRISMAMELAIDASWELGAAARLAHTHCGDPSMQLPLPEQSPVLVET